MRLKSKWDRRGFLGTGVLLPSLHLLAPRSFFLEPAQPRAGRAAVAGLDKRVIPTKNLASQR